MKTPNGNKFFIIFVLFIIIAGIFSYYADYRNYSASWEGMVKKIRFDIKENMIITISDKEYLLEHKWPVLQSHLEIGDSVIKKPKEINITLIKAKTHEKIVCPYN